MPEQLLHGDNLVYTLYDLTPDEIRIVEESAPSSGSRAEPAPTRPFLRRGQAPPMAAPAEESEAQPTPQRAAPPKLRLQPASASLAPGASAWHRKPSATSALKRPESRAPVPLAPPR